MYLHQRLTGSQDPLPAVLLNHMLRHPAALEQLLLPDEHLLH
jgi:hypothetical protein